MHYVEPGSTETKDLYAWKRSGHSFVGFGLGLAAAYQKDRAPFAELAFAQFMGPSVPAIALQLGYAYGFATARAPTSWEDSVREFN